MDNEPAAHDCHVIWLLSAWQQRRDRELEPLRNELGKEAIVRT